MKQEPSITVKILPGNDRFWHVAACRASAQYRQKADLQKRNRLDALAVANWNNYFFAPLTAAFSAAPALNAGTLAAFIFNSAPV